MSTVDQDGMVWEPVSDRFIRSLAPAVRSAYNRMAVNAKLPPPYPEGPMPINDDPIYSPGERVQFLRDVEYHDRTIRRGEQATVTRGLIFGSIDLRIDGEDFDRFMLDGHRLASGPLNEKIGYLANQETN